MQLVVVISLLVLVLSCVWGLKIISVVEKSCRVMTDEGLLDLSLLSNTNGTPRFQKTHGEGGAVVLWNPCTEFSWGNQGDCQSVEACEQYGIISNSVGTKANSNFLVDVDHLYLTYNKHNDPQGAMQIEMICDHSASVDEFQIGGGYNEITSCKLTSRHACLVQTTASPDPAAKFSSLSVGSVLCIGFAIVMILYVVIGVLVMRFKRKATGRSLCPNLSFWSEIPTNVKVGVIYTFSRGTMLPSSTSDSEKYERL